MIDAPPEPPQQEQVILQSLIECGLEERGILVMYEAELHGVNIRIGQTAGATSDQFACIKDAVGYESVTFEDPELAGAYANFVSELRRPEMLARSESALKERGLWDELPQRKDFETLSAFVEALEAHAGLQPGMTLRVSGDGIIFDPARGELEAMNFVDRYSGLLAVIAYVATEERLSFGFIGNEKVRE